MKKRSREGFTLGELLVVVAIISVLVSLTIPSYTKNLEKAKEEQDIGDMKNAYALFESYTISKKKKLTYATGKYFYYVEDEITDVPPTTGQGKGTSKDGGADSYTSCSDYTYSNTTDYTNKAIVCWYNTSTKTVHVHWEEIGSLPSGGGDTGGDDSKTDPTPTPVNPTPTPTEDTSGSTGTCAIGDKKATCTKLPARDDSSDDKYQLILGNLYLYNNVTYVIVGTHNDPYYYLKWGPNPDDPSYSWLYMTPSGRTIYPTQANEQGGITVELKAGDLYIDNGVTYIRTVSSWGSIPSKDSNWVKINF